MSRFNNPLVAAGLTAYAIERQNGWERRQREGTSTWAEQRRFWVDAILQGMARLEGEEPDPRLMERFDHELGQARGSAATVPAPVKLQKETIRNLRCFVSALRDTGDDRRRQIDVAGSCWTICLPICPGPMRTTASTLPAARRNTRSGV